MFKLNTGSNNYYLLNFFWILLNHHITRNIMCYGMLMNNQKMTDVCWGNENIVINPQNIPLLLYYFRSCLQATELLETSDKRSLLEKLSSRINSILPEVKFIFYNGNIDYDVIENMNDLVTEINFMKIAYSDQQSKNNYRSVCDYNAESVGNNIINKRIYRSTGLLKNASKFSPLKLTATLEEKQRACSLLILKNRTSSGYSSFSNGSSRGLMVPVPVIDVIGATPQSIAVPLKEKSIYSVSNKESRNVLVHYYINSMKCLSIDTMHTQADLFEFNNAFCKWLEKEVVPHILLQENYPAFNGVQNILRTMETKGLAEDCINRINNRNSVLLEKDKGNNELSVSSSADNSSGLFKIKGTNSHSSILDYEGVLQTAADTVEEKYSSDEADEFSKEGSVIPFWKPPFWLHVTSLLKNPSKKFWAPFAFIVALLLATWAVAGSLCCVHSVRAKRSKEDKEKSSTDSDKNCPAKGDCCPYGPGENVMVLMKDESGSPFCYYGTFHMDKNKIPKRLPDKFGDIYPVEEKVTPGNLLKQIQSIDSVDGKLSSELSERKSLLDSYEEKSQTDVESSDAQLGSDLSYDADKLKEFNLDYPFLSKVDGKSNNYQTHSKSPIGKECSPKLPCSTSYVIGFKENLESKTSAFKESYFPQAQSSSEGTSSSSSGNATISSSYHSNSGGSIKSSSSQNSIHSTGSVPKLKPIKSRGKK